MIRMCFMIEAGIIADYLSYRGILINIYDNSGQPTNGGKTYIAPGPDVISCSSSSGNSSPSPSSSSGSGSGSASGSGAALYGQCGGQGWTGGFITSSL